MEGSRLVAKVVNMECFLHCQLWNHRPVGSASFEFPWEILLALMPWIVERKFLFPPEAWWLKLSGLEDKHVGWVRNPNSWEELAFNLLILLDRKMKVRLSDLHLWKRMRFLLCFSICHYRAKPHPRSRWGQIVGLQRELRSMPACPPPHPVPSQYWHHQKPPGNCATSFFST